MAFEVVVLQPGQDSIAQDTFTVNGTATALGSDVTPTVNVLLMTGDMTFTLNKAATVTDVADSPGVHKFTVNFTGDDSLPSAAFTMLVLAYDGTDVVGQQTVRLIKPPMSIMMATKGKKKSAKAAPKAAPKIMPKKR